MACSSRVAGFINILSLLLLLCFIHQGTSSNCNKEQSLKFSEERTQEKPQGWKVTIQNECDECLFADIKVKCRGFEPSIKLNPRTFTRLSADECLVDGRGFIIPGGNYSFTYLWYKPVPYGFRFSNATMGCIIHNPPAQV